jgi:hypothetical protein
MHRSLVVFVTLPLLDGCTEATSLTLDRPMDEVPETQRLPNGDRQFRFSDGCVVVLQPDRAVMRSESAFCALYQRDIALLYASAD